MTGRDSFFFFFFLGTSPIFRHPGLHVSRHAVVLGVRSCDASLAAAASEETRRRSGIGRKKMKNWKKPEVSLARHGGR
jgi:hypothetical protein